MGLWRRLSVRARLTLFAGVVAALLSTLLATVLMVAINRLATEYLTNEITAAGGRVASVVERGTPLNPLPHGLIQNIQIVDPRGKVVASTPGFRGKPPMASFRPTDSRNAKTSVVCDRVFPRDECDIVVAQSAYRDGQLHIVYSASPVVPYLVHPKLALVLFGGAVFLTAAVTYGSYRIVRGSLTPVDAIRSELDEINATCPGRRVPVPSGKDEIHDMAESVNHTLDRLQDAMERQRQFASDASHDLRSPITAMRAEVEDALMAPEVTNVTVLGGSLLSSLNRLQAIVSDLLMVARLDAGAPGARETVDLSALVDSELDRRHSTKKIKREIEPGVTVTGDRLRLTRLLTNLMDNAERHADSSVTVSVRREPGDREDDARPAPGVAVLEVQDDGAGIEPGKRGVVFQRFTRLDASRNKDAGGTGLGLPIARQIAETGGGTLTIEPSRRGARFVLRMPHAEPPAGDIGGDHGGAHRPGRGTEASDA
ncbi:HAMP domain-containing sensor histidine kinase [Sphaerisporangium sp. NPDC088356]|uniref:sensor histidine kinase n=1 Tax=Sphaerisporangium sp. NPDC088356 TaxID=3154871 RepID=UPI00342D37A1